VAGGSWLVQIWWPFAHMSATDEGAALPVMRRLLHDSPRQTLTIPRHAELDKGTLKAIYRQTLRYIPEGVLQSSFLE